MHTLITDSPLTAAETIRAGGLAAFPTETVYGLGADALDTSAVQRVYGVKGRPLDNPLIVHLATTAAIDSVARVEMHFVRSLIEAFIPGPLTLVLKRTTLIADAVTAGLDTVAVRVPNNSLAQEFISACGRPVAAPSANKSGRPSPTTWEAVREDFDGEIECILRGPRSTIGLESTVVDCTSETPVLLREGAVTLGQLREVVDLATLDASTQADELAATVNLARSPGLRHRHYAPRAHVVFSEGVDTVPDVSASYIGLTQPQNASSFVLVRICRDVEEYGYELYQFFRDSDALGVARIYCDRPPRSGLGRTIIDRISRASRG